MDAASARPEACRDKSKGPRSGDFAGRSPGVQGAAATGRPLCAPCAIRDITQKTNRERNLPGINIEVVALPGAVRTRTFPVVPLFCLVAAAPYPAWGPKSPLALRSLKLPVLAASKSLRRSRQAGGTGGGGDWPPPVRSLRHD